MPARSKSWVILVGLVLLFTWTNPAFGGSIDLLERLANSDFIPEFREAAGKALARNYIVQNIQPPELIRIAETANTDQLRDAAIKALSRSYEDAKGVDSSEETVEKTKQLEEKVKTGETPAVRRAASTALGFYYLACNVNDIGSYSPQDLERIATGAEEEGLRRAATSALKYIYPSHYSAEGLINLINSSSHETIRRGAAGALAIRYSTRMSPDPELGELRRIASDENENRWLREAAGQAFGVLASDILSSEELKELSLTGNTEEIRAGASRAWSRILIRSDKTKEELLRMVSAATGFAPLPYRSAITRALADRMIKVGTSIQGG